MQSLRVNLEPDYNIFLSFDKTGEPYILDFDARTYFLNKDMFELIYPDELKQLVAFVESDEQLRFLLEED